MYREEVIARLQESVGGYLRDHGLELVELIYRQEGGGDFFLRFLVDRPEGGISLGECANLNKEISSILDAEDMLQIRDILEVSSPGLDRSLKTKNDFLRCLNKSVRFFLNTLVCGKLEHAGIIREAKDESGSVETKEGIMEIPLATVNKAKQIITESKYES